MLAAVESGIGKDTVLPRLKELEKERDQIDRDLVKAKHAFTKPVDVAEASKSVAKFLLEFTQNFEKAPVELKKEMLRRIVLGISVNPEERVARCAITQILMVNQALTALINPSEFVGARCSGGTHLPAVTTFHALFQMELE